MKTNKFSILNSINSNVQLEKIYSEYNNTYQEISIKTLHELFSESAGKHPDKIAIIQEESKITYRDLEEKSNQVANYLIKKGLNRTEAIGVFTPRKISSIMYILGILKAGCAYVPIDMEYPQERVDYIVHNSGCSTVLPEDIYEVESLYTYDKDFSGKNDVENLAYIIYTSGSTGKPKGVAVTHKSVCNTILDINNKFNVTDNDRIIALSSMCFDLSVYDIFGCFAAGATLVQIEDQRDIRDVKEVLTKQKITIWNSIPSTLSMFVNNINDQSFKSLKLRLILLSGDWIPLRLAEDLKQYFPNSQNISLGGATEAAIWSIYYPFSFISKQWKSIPYGYPLANQKIYILNYQQELCPQGVEGEIYIGGIGVAQGYMNDSQKTKESFMTHKQFGRLYKTGDFGVFTKEGYVEFIGRKDNQVKIRGYRVELGEVESVLNRYPGVAAGVAIVKADQLGNNYLCAYIVENDDTSVESLKEFMKAYLPPYMIPAKVMKLESLPLNENGKIDRKQLPKIEDDFITTPILKQIPENDLELKLISIFEKTFNNGVKITATDNFFELGINSILMVGIITKLEEEFKIHIKFKEFLKRNNIRELSELICQSSEIITNNSAFTNMVSDVKNLHQPFPISDVQLAYFMGRDNAFELGGVSTHAYGEIITTLEMKKFALSLQKVIDRHPVLQSVILSDGTQKILEDCPKYDMKLIDYSNLSPEQFAEKVSQQREEMSHHVFKTDQWPLFNFMAYKMDDSRYYMFIEYDLLIGDGMSMRILMNELFEFYNNPELILPNLNYTFRDYMIALQDFKKSETYKKSKSYWINKIEDFPSAPQLPYKEDPANIITPHFDRVAFTFSQTDLIQLRKQAKIHNVTISALLCTAFSKVLGYWSNQPHHAINLTVFNRYPFHKDVDNIIGDFTSSMLIEANFSSNSGFWKDCSNIQNTLMEALENRHYNGVEFIRELSKYHGIENKAIMPIVFTSMIFDQEDKKQNNADSLGETVLEMSQTSQVFLDFQVSDDNGELKMSWDYVTELLDKKLINNMFYDYINWLKSVIKGEDNYKFELNEHDRFFINAVNDTNKDFQLSLLHQGVYNQALMNPENIAVKFGTAELTYEQLNKKSNQIGHFLKDKGIRKGDYVAVIGSRSPETIVRMLGVLKTGAAFIPIEASYPDDRKQYIISRCNAAFVFDTDSDMDIKRYSEEDLPLINDTNDIAYIIFTSGSTGKPKGVKITHGAAYNTIYDINNRFSVTSSDKLLGISSISFDLSIYDIFGAQFSGAQLVQVEDSRDMGEVFELINRERITVYNSVPALMELIVNYIPDNYQNNSLRVILLSGDWINVNLPDKLYKAFSSSRVISLGGATEAAIWSIYYEIESVDKNWTSIPYGTPLWNQKIYILNTDNQLCPVNVQGEIYIGGFGVAAGYISDNEKDRDAFVSHNELGNLYKTGDFGVLTEEGYIKFLGRRDNQVKIGGFRIELGEIEATLERTLSIEKAIVLSNKYLCAYLVTDSNIDESDIQKKLSLCLPDYMIPTSYIKIKEIPLTANGKVNKTALPKPLHDDTERVSIPPKTKLQRELLNIWKGVLNKDEISMNDNFYHLGGHSILMISIITKIENLLDVRVKYKEFIDNCTLSELAGLIESKTEKQEFKYPEAKINPEDLDKPFPLTDVQMAYLIGRNSSFDLGGISTHLYTEVETSLDINRLNDALNKVILRHPMLRAIILNNGEQVILDQVPLYTINVTDISHLGKEQQLERILLKRAELSEHSFITDKWPLFNFEAYRLNDKYYLFVEFDQLIADGMSIQILTRDLIDFYQDENLEIKNTNFTFRDYMMEYQNLKSSNKYKEDRKYWLSQINDFPQAPALPVKKNKSGKYSFSRLSKVFNQDEWNNLKSIAANLGVSTSALLCSVYSKTLSIWSNQSKLALNVTVFNRYPLHEDVMKLVGDFTSVILLDINTDCQDFEELMQNVQNVLVESLDHRHFEGVEFIRELSKHNNVVNQAIMPVVFTSMLFGDERDVDYLDLIGKRKYIATQTSQVYLDHQASDVNGELILTWDYMNEVFDKGTIESMFTHYIAGIEAIAKNDLAFHSGADDNNKVLIENYNHTAAPVYHCTLNELLNSSYANYKSKTAIICKGDTISYGELNVQSNKMANYLIDSGIKPGEHVAIKCYREINAIICILGVLKAGAAYIPVDPQYPEERINYIVENSESRLLIDSENLNNIINNYSENYEPLIKVCEDGLAYIIYTSGSTGTPKGVKISHKSAVNTIAHMNNKYQITSDDVFAGISSMCFDLSVYDIFGSLANGSTLVMIEDQRDIKEILRLIKKYGITIWNSVPAIMSMAMEYMENSSKNNYRWNKKEQGNQHINNKLYFWSPIKPWKIKDKSLSIGDDKFNNPAALELIPQIYFAAQDGITLESLKDLFNESEKMNIEEIIDTLINKEILINHIVNIEQLFSSQDDLLQHDYGTDLLFNKDAYEKFKERQLSRMLDTKLTNSLKLAGDFKLPKNLEERKSIRNFSKEKIPFNSFSMLLTIFRQKYRDGIKSYYYASAGGLYPIDVYIYIKKDRVEGINAGLYYYNPMMHQISLINEQEITTDAHYFSNKEIFKESAFSIYLIYNAEVSMPRYAGAGYSYSLIDTGIMVAAFTEVCQELNIGVCSIGDMNFDRIRELFFLNDNQVLTHTIEAGIIEDKEPVSYSPIIEPNLNEEKNDLSSLRLVLLSGDWINLSLPDAIRKYTNARIISLGGATEAAIWSIYFEIADVKKDWASIPYGMPLPNQTIYILDNDLNISPVNAIGEIFIGGIGVADGYMNSDKKDRQAFIEHKTLGRIYRTGDYGIMKADGYVELLGRKDNQVKVNGFRIELEEIESKLKSFIGIRDCVVNIQNDNDSPFIAAYYVADEKIKEESLTGYLKTYLPTYMIPKYYVQIDRILLTDNGKIDRKSLPKISPQKQSSPIEPPNTKLEKILCNLFREILETGDIGVNSDFFELGGDSIKATKFIARVQELLNIDIGFEIFRLSRISELTGFINEKSPHLFKEESNLFLFSDIKGQVDQYADLCKNLSDDYKCFGLNADWFDLKAVDKSLEEICSDYVDDILALQEDGEYYLLGWCFGGVLAYETARQLTERHKKVKFLGVLDSLQPGAEIDEQFDFSFEAEVKIVESLFDLKINKADIMNAEALWKYVIEYLTSAPEVFEIFKNSFGYLSFIVQSNDPAESVRKFNLFRSFSNAQKKYKPEPKVCSNHSLLVRANQSFINMDKEQWLHYLGESCIYMEFDDEHIGILKAPIIEEISKNIINLKRNR